jgi:hypothetical protein
LPAMMKTQETQFFWQNLCCHCGDESKVLNYVPGINLVYKEVLACRFYGGCGRGSFSCNTELSEGAELFGNILGSQVYDPGNQSSKIASGLFLLHGDITSMKDLTDKALKENVILAKRY